MNVLVLDDEHMLRQILEESLRQMGHTAVGVACGRDAVSEYERAIVDGTPFDVAIVDLNLDGGVMDGCQTAKRLLTIDPKAALIVSTGSSNDPVAKNFSDYGFAGCLCKPFRLNELTQMLDALSPNLRNQGRSDHVQTP